MTQPTVAPETTADLAFYLRRMSDQSGDQIDADRLCRAADMIEETTALRAERDKAMAESEGALMILTQERAERDDYVAKLNTRIAALEADAQAARDQVAGAHARGVQAGRAQSAKACDKIAGNTADFVAAHRRAAGQCAAAIRALADAPPAPVVKIKPLVWVDGDRNGGFYCEVPIGHGFSGYYDITQEDFGLATVEFGIHCHGFGSKVIWKGPTGQAKAAAQSDYEARAALLPQAEGGDA